MAVLLIAGSMFLFLVGFIIVFLWMHSTNKALYTVLCNQHMILNILEYQDKLKNESVFSNLN
jgi:glucan phosphoethanolaminetransferase (alkaline phosphatase superfamily)